MTGTAETNAPTKKSHANAIVLSIAAFAILAIVGTFVAIALVHAAQARHDSCVFDKLYQGYSQFQAEELCK